MHSPSRVIGCQAPAGLPMRAMLEVLESFPGLSHRSAWVAEIAGVRFYNDSKATSVDAAMKALDSFAGNLWVILGGKDKGSDYTPLRDRLHQKARAALLIGSAAAKIASQIEGATKVIRADTLECAVADAWKNSQPGDTVLLAPACSSFDQFQSYEHRGRVFKDLVNGLQTKNGATA